MTQIFFPEWLNQFSTNPYAVLGLSVAADDRRVLKRYHAIAKRLHPDSDPIADGAMRDRASQMLARLVNPAYQRLKQEKTRAEEIAILRLRAKSLSREGGILPKSEVAQQLLKMPPQEVDVFYEQTIASLAESQYHPLSQFEYITQQIAELNVLYLHLKANEPTLREKPTGIMSAKQAKPAQFTPSTVETAQIAVSYAQRHYDRAKQYAKQEVWQQVVLELRDAIRLEPNRSEYHSLLATAYLMQHLTGMAKVHFRQALKFNPNDPLALRYAAKLGIVSPSAIPPTAPTPPPNKTSSPRNTPPKGGGTGLFSLFGKRK
ncbi:molecular chaperone DnaJ [filamentous cyanobacterium CCP1]|nr:molecular chaperone DnaJ [filamentous cyanobacterium CCP1]